MTWCVVGNSPNLDSRQIFCHLYTIPGCSASYTDGTAQVPVEDE